MGNNQTSAAKEKTNQTPQVEQKSYFKWSLLSAKKRVSITDTAPHIIGVIYPKIFLHTQQSSGIYLQWRELGVIEEIMTVLHGRVREKAEKKTNGQL